MQILDRKGFFGITDMRKKVWVMFDLHLGSGAGTGGTDVILNEWNALGWVGLDWGCIVLKNSFINWRSGIELYIINCINV